jgi:hypothetical protein
MFKFCILKFEIVHFVPEPGIHIHTVHQNTICRLIIFLFGFEILHETAGGKGNFKMSPGAKYPRFGYITECLSLLLHYRGDFLSR